MQRYFFYLHNHLEVRDDEGKRLTDLAAVRAYAIDSARDIMMNNVRYGEITLSHRIEIEDAQGRPVMTVRFGDALIIRP